MYYVFLKLSVMKSELKLYNNSHNALFKNVFIVSYENRILCKIKCKSKQTGVQKGFYVFITWKILQRHCEKKDCCAKIYFTKINVYK